MAFFSRSLLLLVLGSPAAFGQTCPAVPDGTACTFEYDPVTCDDGCAYENPCEAAAAGQTNCSPSCADPDPNVVCTREYAPVACGGFTWCIYDNLCLALAAGKKEVDCKRSCPEVPDGTACTLDFSPQFCGGCFYESLCLATAAWEGAGLSADNCVDITEYVTPPDEGSTCPPIVIPSACDSTFRPVTCDGDCYYNNQCLADEAGATNCVSTCSAPPDNDCNDVNEAFICQDGCTYRNGCLAEASGFDPATQCAPICRFDLEAAEAACPTIYDPIFCLGCTFDNDCIASSVGFNVALDCQPIATPFTQSTNPTDTNTTTTSGGAVVKTLASVIAAASVSFLA